MTSRKKSRRRSTKRDREIASQVVEIFERMRSLRRLKDMREVLDEGIEMLSAVSGTATSRR